MRKFLLAALAGVFLLVNATAQEFMSNADLMAIKEESEMQRMTWNKLFDDAISGNNFSALPAARQQYEAYLDKQGVRMRQLLFEGDGRALLTAINNYVQIQKQFARDVMQPAEGLAADNTDEIAKINQRISDFAQKEKVFIIEINNAIRTSPEPIAPVDQAMNEEDEEEVGDEAEAKPKRKATRRQAAGNEGRRKLPHEIADEKKDEESEDEE